ncbi:MAG: GNAT family N-acetyltransferase [Cyclobacteriaceae bacterium]|nr:GNAT family N-acetyltransferase [Cyclobacteriaceae bacterium]
MIRSYVASDKPTLLNLIRANTPAYFDKVEETDFEKYLDNEIEDYYVIERNEKIIGCGGINYEPESNYAVISWDIIYPNYQGKGIGKELLEFRINKIKEKKKHTQVIVRTSQFTFKFYEKAGFKLIESVKNYWAKGIDLYYMTLVLE